MAAYFLYVSKGFVNRKASVAAGVFIGLAALSKQTFLIFLAGPLIWAAIYLIKNITTGSPSDAEKRSKSKAVAGIVLSNIFAWLFSWWIYSKPHRTALDNWLCSSTNIAFPWSMTFLIISALLLGGGLSLLFIRSTPIRNSLSAGMISIFTAGLWYFPKGLGNFMAYFTQMKMNVEKSQMTPSTLVKFYYEHLQTYYLGPVLLWVCCGALVFWFLLFIASPFLKRHFFLNRMVPSLNGLLFSLVWLAIPTAAFFFINIQNEMNTVPLLPPLFLIIAVLLAKLRLHYSKKSRQIIKKGGRLLSARLTKGLLTLAAFALLGATMINGLFMSWIFKDGDEYQALPVKVSQATARFIAPRKFNDLNYLVPRPTSWFENEITRLMIDKVKKEKPKILVMDVQFYFSWNTFWYMFKLAHMDVEIQTQWSDDGDLLTKKDGKVPLFDYDLILFRQPWKSLYAEAYNDYIEYKNLWRTFEYLSKSPEEFSNRYINIGIWKLPDGSQAFLMLKRAENVLPEP